MVGFKGQTQRHSSLCQSKTTDYSGKESGLCKFVFICLLQIFFFGGGGFWIQTLSRIYRCV